MNDLLSGQDRAKSSTGEEHPGIGEEHYVNRSGWLRAAVLGANDGLLSTGSLMVGVAAATTSSAQLVLTGVAGVVAGAMSMAVGEYVSVSSQSDIEEADRKRESEALAQRPKRELHELSSIYQGRGLPSDLACDVAKHLTERDALDAHMRDELGVTETSAANPVQASVASAASFVSGGIAPLLVAILVQGAGELPAMVGVTIVMLGLLGALGAWAGGAQIGRGVIRVVLFGSIAMAVSGLVGHFFHAAI